MTTASNRNELAKMLKQQRHMAELTLSELAAKSSVSASQSGKRMTREGSRGRAVPPPLPRRAIDGSAKL